MKKLDAFKLSLLAISMAGVGVGCASSGYTQTDNADHAYHNGYYDHDMARREGEARVTVSALSFTPETRAAYVNKFPFYDQNWKLRDISVYTFAVHDPELHASASSDLPHFSENLPPGSVFVESAGGAGEVRTGRVIQHSPMLSR
jgi:hypothetical protein